MQFYSIHYNAFIKNQWRTSNKLNVVYIVFIRMDDNWGCSVCCVNRTIVPQRRRTNKKNKSLFLVHFFQISLSIIYVICVSELLFNSGVSIKTVAAIGSTKKHHVFIDDQVVS